MKDKKIRIRMLGNHLDREFGKEYDVSEETAAQLSGMGVAVILVDHLAAKPAEKEADNGL